MKSQRGVTLTSLAIYVLLVLVVLGMLAVIRANFQSNLKEINAEGTKNAEIDKFNTYFLQEVKKQGNEVASISEDKKEITFSSENKYTFKDQAIYLNDNIKIAENIEKCEFNTNLENGKTVISVAIRAKDSEEKRIEYVLNSDNYAISYENERNYTSTEVPIPNGFVISGVAGENTVEEGLVIYEMTKEQKDAIDWTDESQVEIAKQTYNQFVWIPVENPVLDLSAIIQAYPTDDWGDLNTAIKNAITISDTTKYPMAAKLGDGNYVGILYEFDSTTGKVNGIQNRIHEEPYNLTGKKALTDLDVAGTGIPEGTYAYDSQEMFTVYGGGTYTEDMYQKEFNEMVEKVSNSGGLYIGRYQTGGFNGDVAVSKKGEADYSINHATWYKMYRMQKEFGNGKSVGSSMIWGSQYDQVMIFVNGKLDGSGEIFNVGTDGSRNYGTSVNTGTGNNSKDKVANIYDLEGMMYEWALDSYGSFNKILHGGQYGISYSASNRRSYNPNMAFQTYGSRLALYIK